MAEKHMLMLTTFGLKVAINNDLTTEKRNFVYQYYFLLNFI